MAVKPDKDARQQSLVYLCPNCGHKPEIPGAKGVPLSLAKETADTLDSFHRTVNGVGRIVVLSDADKRNKALELFDAQAKG